MYYISTATVCACVYVCVLVKEGSLWTSEVALIPWSSCSSVVPQPGGQTRFSEVHIALIESLHAIRLIMDVVCDIFQVLKMRPTGSTKTVPFYSSNPLIKRCMAVQLHESVTHFQGVNYIKQPFFILRVWLCFQNMKAN